MMQGVGYLGSSSYSGSRKHGLILSETGRLFDTKKGELPSE